MKARRLAFALFLAACGSSHGPSDGAPDGAIDAAADGGASVTDAGADDCDLDSPLSCGACDTPCERNESCIDRACVPNPVQISLGDSHLLVRTPDGRVHALGSPVPPGLLGPDAVDALAWRSVRALEGAALPAYSSWHVCVAQDGEARCWGDNSELQLGVAEPAWSVDSVAPALPVEVQSVAVGPSHSCAVGADDSVLCWGSNMEHAIREDDELSRTLPVRIEGRAASALALGIGISCVVDLEGHLGCFGRNASVRWPARVPDPTRVARVLNRGCVCPVYVDGSAGCGGCNFPELTLQDGIDNELYATLDFLEAPVIDLARGLGTYALQADGRVLAWGRAERLGPHIAGPGYASAGIVGPLVVPVPPMATLACVWGLCCGVSQEQELWCWGASDAAGGALWPDSESEWRLERVPLP